jgi:hypothetical protein
VCVFAGLEKIYPAKTHTIQNETRKDIPCKNTHNTKRN